MWLKAAATGVSPVLVFREEPFEEFYYVSFAAVRKVAIFIMANFYRYESWLSSALRSPGDLLLLIENNY